MAEVTVLAGGHMIGCRILADGVLTVVTPFAGDGHALVVKHTGGKTIGVMAHTAILGRGNVRSRFSNSRRAIVAGGTIAGDTGVIENRR